MSISALGLNSGVLTADLIDSLIASEKQPITNRLDIKQQKFEAQLSAFGLIKSSLSDLRLSSRSLDNISNINTLKATSSDSSIKANATNTAQAGTYNVSVNQLAQSHTLVTDPSAAFSAKSSVVGEGKLTISFGTTDYDKGSDTYNSFTTNPNLNFVDIDIDSSNNTLEGIKDAINKSGATIEAGIINDGSGYRLTIKSTATGEAQSLNIAVTDSDGNNTNTSGLSVLAFNAGASNMIQTFAGQDAKLSIDGVDITRTTNEIADVIQGVTLNVSNVASNQTVTVAGDSTALVDKVKGFVEEFNKFNSLVKDYSKFDTDTMKGNVLTGDSTLRNITNQIRGTVSKIADGLENNTYRALADIGFKTDPHSGELQFDESKFLTAFDKKPADVYAIFGQTATSTSNDIGNILGATGKKAGSYDVNITQSAERATYTGNKNILNLNIGSAADDFKIKVNGAESGALKITQKTYASEAELAAEFEKVINIDSAIIASGGYVNVSVINNKLVFESKEFGGTQSIEFTTTDTNFNTKYGITTGTTVSGQDVAGTLNGEAATGLGNLLSAHKDSLLAGLSVEVGASVSGDLGKITLSHGTGTQLIDHINSFLSAKGSVLAKTNNLETQLAFIAEQRADLDKRMENSYARLQSQFMYADRLVGTFNSTQSYIVQQMDAMLSVYTNKK